MGRSKITVVGAGNVGATLAQRLADVCLADPKVTEVRITVHKPSAPIAFPFTDVAVSIRRTRP